MATVEEEVPPLASGDFLTRDEFIRRWEAQPRIKFAELIGGVVCMPSAVSSDHGDMDGAVGTWLGVYAAATPGCLSGRWHRLSRGAYRIMKPGPDGLLRSKVFPGLWLDGEAMLVGDMKRVLAKLQEGLRSQEHKTFADRLAAKRKANERADG